MRSTDNLRIGACVASRYFIVVDDDVDVVFVLVVVVVVVVLVPETQVEVVLATVDEVMMAAAVVVVIVVDVVVDIVINEFDLATIVLPVLIKSRLSLLLSLVDCNKIEFVPPPAPAPALLVQLLQL